MAPITALIHAYLDGELTDSSKRELESWLDASVKNVELFVAECQVHSLLHDYLGVSHEQLSDFANQKQVGLGSPVVPIQLLDREHLDEYRGLDEIGLFTGIGENSPSASSGLPDAVLSNTDLTPSSLFFTGWPLAYMVASVVFALGALIGALTHVSQPTQLVVGSPATSNQRAAIPSTGRVGRITGMVDCESSDLKTAMIARVVCLGQKYAFDAGLMEITYDTGARVLLQGPVTYEVDSADGGFLSAGKLTARLDGTTPPLARPTSHQHPLPAHLFTVKTPTAVVTDLGTEFAVDVDEQGETQTHVFVGKVKVTGKGQSEKTASSQSEVVLQAGQTIRTERQRLIPVPQSLAVDEESFIRVMPASREREAAGQYAELVMSLKPVLYYRMEPPKAGDSSVLVLDETGSGYNGVLAFSDHFHGSPYVEGRFGQALRFRGSTTGDHVIVRNYPKAKDDELTVSAWVLVGGRSSWPMIAANWGLRDAKGEYCSGQFFLGLSKQGEGLAAKITQRNGEIIALDEDDSTSTFPQGQWQHVALVIDRTSAQLFHNGVPVATRSVEGIMPQPPMASLGIGCRTNYLGSDVEWKEPCLWLGRIDELAFFNHALTVEEIQRLHSFGSSPAR